MTLNEFCDYVNAFSGEKKKQKIEINWIMTEPSECMKEQYPTQYHWDEMRKEVDERVRELNDELDGINN